MLENELLMREFAEEVVKEGYSEEKLLRFNSLLTRVFDNDMFDIIMGQKGPEAFKGMYDEDICADIAQYAEKRRQENRPV